MTEQSTTDQPMGNTTHQPAERSALVGVGLPMLGLVIIVAALIWGFRDTPTSNSVEPAPISAAQAPESQPPNATEPAVAETYAQPIQQPELAPEPQPALSLEALNTRLPDEMAAWRVEPLGSSFARQSNALERGIAMIDNLRQGEVPYKLLPIARPKQAFSIVDNGLAVSMNPQGFSRYDGLVDTLTRLDTEAVIRFFRQCQSTLESAWAALGYTELSLENAILATLDAVLLTPEIPPDARLLKKEANWVYEDETLEALPALQKQIIRMGPKNTQSVQDIARSLRGAMLDSADSVSPDLPAPE